MGCRNHTFSGYDTMNQYTGMASMIRYQAKGRRLVWESRRMNVLMAMMAEMNATTEPQKRNGISAEVKRWKDLRRSYPAAPMMMGTAAMKEYSAALRRETPRSMPPRIVDAERENPGQRARH